MTVAPGTLITVVNEDAAPHTVTATGGKAFDTGDVAEGQTVTFTAPAEAGTYAYICTIHPLHEGFAHCPMTRGILCGRNTRLRPRAHLASPATACHGPAIRQGVKLTNP
ncbi:hypothetical protein ABT126_11150 [Streptomyces sp. NPDC002012]|uniref:hypothetical protein n=1 Tax=Streptomyces sp. NPDC002012 TaxID=3154532 RepID=UPI00332F227B